MSKIRADQQIAELFPDLSRSKVQSLIEKQKILMSEAGGDWQVISKPGLKVQSLKREDIKFLDDEELQYVSRGALKLKKALETFAIDPEDNICLDVGLSTGGFSDLLLQLGAQKVLGVDVGRAQLHEKMKSNQKLLFADKVNAREPLPEPLLVQFFADRPFHFDLVCIDVSFISLSLIIPNIKNYLKPGAVIVALIKPQFELQKSDLNKKGVVKDLSRVTQAVEKIIGVFQENGLEQISTCESPIEGDDGNKEYLAKALLRS